jgi:amphi-Trp domain-containing protein
MEKKTIEIEATMNREQTAAYFRMLANGLESGSLEIKSGEEVLTLSPSDMISVEIEAKQKKDKSKFSMEMSWRLNVPAATPEAPAAPPAAE